ncbi:MAG: ROK family protein [Balneolales bacterium]|nr:ROK family protein [Balneolales bacterium]
MLAIGIDLGGTNIKSALIHPEKGILEQHSISTEADAGLEATLDRIASTINKVKESAELPVMGVGMGAPGMISLDRKSVHNPPNLPGWEHVMLADEIKKRTGLDALIENDANLMALGSARFGSGRPYEHFIMITLGTGVGGGIIFNNRIFRGATGAAAELGHVTIDYNGARCNSTVTGAVEGYLGQRFLSQRAGELIAKEPKNELFIRFNGDFEKLEPRDLSDAANRGNKLAISILEDAGNKLGFAIVNYVHTLDIRKIVVSGGVSKAGEWILKPALKTAMEQLMPPFRTDFEIIPELLGNEAALLGAGTLALENI